MSDIARTLLVEYYGFGEKSKDKNFLSIHECIDDAQNLPHKSIVENSSLDAKENSTSTEKKSEEEYTASDEIDSPIQQHKTSFRILDVEVFDVSDENVTNLNAIDKIDTEYNVLEYLQSASTKKLTSDNNPPNVGKTMLEIPGGEEVDRSEANHSYIEEALDSVSEISSISTKKKSQKSAKAKIAVSSVVPKREPICNETFADYSKVELTEFPREIPETFPNLRMLYLANNNLTELPDELFHNLQSLEWLDVRNNQLTSLPSAIKSHNSLETLLLQENRLQTLPLELCTLPRLKILHVAHNPLLMPPKDITALGPPGILNFLRLEWNKMHPDEEILPREPKIEPKLSTILCYQSPRKDDKKTTRSTHPKALFDDPSKKLCSREKGKLYKPSSRCKNEGRNVQLEQRLMWISKVKEEIGKQSSILQKRKDEIAVKRWRHDRRSFTRSMQKAESRNEDNIPFAIDLADYGSMLKSKSVNRMNLNSKGKSILLPPLNINNKICELLDSLKQLQCNGALDTLTPKSQQKILNTKIQKILSFQDEIQNLRRHNDALALKD
ncbi:hypothetical protein KM043_001313 [Ampulex compressa]|nr:hypothetical protein KM043_001313 [Ampulex compressa]